MSTFEQKRFIRHKVQKDDTFDKLAEKFGSDAVLMRKVYREHFEKFVVQPEVGKIITIPMPDVVLHINT